MVDSNAPTPYKHTHQNKKRKQLQSERRERIARDNQILFHRIVGRDNNPAHHVAGAFHRSKAQQKSLNFELRRREHEQILQGNKAMLLRIENTKSAYGHTRSANGTSPRKPTTSRRSSTTPRQSPRMKPGLPLSVTPGVELFGSRYSTAPPTMGQLQMGADPIIQAQIE